MANIHYRRCGMFNLFRLFCKQQLYKIFSFNSLKFNLSQRAGLNYFSLMLFLSLLIFATSCNTTEPPIIIPPPPVVKDTITVFVESFTHRSITLNIQSTDNSKQSTIRVLRIFKSITTTIADYPIQVKDTTIIDDDNGTGLLLDTSYTYYAVRVDSLGQLKDTSNIVTQKTLAPTSHNYTWQEFTIGDAGFSNALYDVWGTDENNVWAVGTVFINDTAYGVIKWDGNEWLPVLRRGGYNAIYGFSNNDIWAVGNVIYHFDGINWTENRNQVLNDNIPYTSIWGTSSSNLYLGNAWGKIIHWDGSKATLASVQGEQGVSDIWGFSENEIYAVVGTPFTAGGQVFYFNGTNWQLIIDINAGIEPIDFKGNLLSLWGTDPEFLFVGGSYLYNRTSDTWSDLGRQQDVIQKIRGLRSNNIFAVGLVGFAKHFNGVDWNYYNELTNPYYFLESIYITENKIFIAGSTLTQGIIIIGTK